jgi:hypothetical protein
MSSITPRPERSPPLAYISSVIRDDVERDVRRQLQVEQVAQVAQHALEHQRQRQKTDADPCGRSPAGTEPRLSASP